MPGHPLAGLALRVVGGRVDINKNKEILLAHEREFSAKLATAVIARPKLSTWMIFIPFIFIFYFQDLSQYKKQRKAFIAHYFLSRERAVNEAARALEEKQKPDTAAFARQADLKGDAVGKYARFMGVLADHYTNLLSAADPVDFFAMVKAAYGPKRGNYLLFINQLETAEKDLNQTLKSQMRKTTEGVGDTIRKIEIQSRKLRRKEMEKIYP